MQFQRLGYDLADLHARTERSVRILKNNLKPAASPPKLLSGQPTKVASVKPDAARGRLHREQEDGPRGE